MLVIRICNKIEDIYVYRVGKFCVFAGVCLLLWYAGVIVYV